MLGDIEGEDLIHAVEIRIGRPAPLQRKFTDRYRLAHSICRPVPTAATLAGKFMPPSFDNMLNIDDIEAITAIITMRF